jgi:hypothetical protein
MANSLIDSYAQLYNEKGGVTDNDKSEMMWHQSWPILTC